MTPFGSPPRRLLPRQLSVLLITAVITVLGILALVLVWWHPQTERPQPWEFWASISAAGAVVMLLLLALLRVRHGQTMLLSLERNFLEFMDAAADMMVISSLDGQIIDVNRRTCELLGYKREHLLGKMLWDLDIDCYLRQHPHTRYYLERGRTISYETWYRAADGRRVPVESRARKAWWRDQPCLIELVRDITARRQADDALQESTAAVERARNLLETRMLERTEELQRRIIERNLAEKRARELSVQKLALEREKLAVGRSSNFQVVSYEVETVNAKNQELQAVINYLNSLTALDQTLGTTLITWDIDIGERIDGNAR